MIALRKRQFLMGTATVAVIVFLCTFPTVRWYLRWHIANVDARSRFTQIKIGMALEDAMLVLDEWQVSEGCPNPNDGLVVKGRTFYCWQSDHSHQIRIGIEGSKVVGKWMYWPGL